MHKWSGLEVGFVTSIVANCFVQMFYKSARVEYVPVGVVGAIVPWNYPFHNVFNPLVAALYAGNAIVIKVPYCTKPACTIR